MSKFQQSHVDWKEWGALKSWNPGRFMPSQCPVLSWIDLWSNTIEHPTRAKWPCFRCGQRSQSVFCCSIQCQHDSWIGKDVYIVIIFVYIYSYKANIKKITGSLFTTLCRTSACRKGAMTLSSTNMPQLRLSAELMSPRSRVSPVFGRKLPQLIWYLMVGYCMILLYT